jgi:hypothetical protein
MHFLKKIERKYPFNLISILIGIGSLAIGIFFGFSYEKSAKLAIEVFSSAPLFNVREDVRDFKVVFEGENILQSDKILTLINFRIVNNGNSTIKPSDFDKKILPSISVDQGELVRVKVLNKSHQYYDSFSDITPSNNSIELPPFIMSNSDYVSLSFLVFHNKEQNPALEADGKIANVSNISVVDLNANKSGPSITGYIYNFIVGSHESKKDCTK